MANLGAFFVALAGPVVKKAMTALGIGIVSYAAISTALTSALGAAKSAWSGFGGDSLALLELSGVSTALSIVAGALIARVALMQLKKLELIA